MSINTVGNDKEMERCFFRASAQGFNKIPGNPVAYWLDSHTLYVFENYPPLKQKAVFRAGLQTGDNDTFLRFWHEINKNLFYFNCKSREEALKSKRKWFPLNKGGGFRKWHGNKEHVINWSNDGYEIKERKTKDLALGKITANNSKCWNQEFYFKHGLTWSSLTSGNFSLRDNGHGFLFDTKGQMLFPKSKDLKDLLLGVLNSKVSQYLLAALAPTLDFNSGVVSLMPLAVIDKNIIDTSKLICIAANDWDSYETSWDFTTLPLLQPNYRQATLAATYQSLRTHWQENILEMQRLEEENNRIFIEAYGLEDELTPDVPLEEITLTCNPHYRYRLGKAWDDKSEEERTTELETRLQQDTAKEFISYAVGCMFGRYSLDKEGLVLANQGETLEDYLAQVPNPSFMPDDDNVIPMLDGDWFTDDVVERFKEFLKTTFGEEHYETNLAFIEKALNVKGTRNYSIRDYFLKEFYNDHVRTYKKRPIYWLFSSPKGSFNALVYMHRYRPDTVSVVLNGYLREYQTKLKSHKQNLEAISIGGGSQTEKTHALKEIERINKVLHELEEYERDVVYPLATEQVSIDLDDGVKQNYPKLGKALKKVTGL